MLSRRKAGGRSTALSLLFCQGDDEDGGEGMGRMRSDAEVVLVCSMTAPFNLKRKPQLLVLLSRVAEAPLLEKKDWVLLIELLLLWCCLEETSSSQFLSVPQEQRSAWS